MLSLILTEYLNSVLIVDLYLSITNPFVPRESRLKYYFIMPALILLTYIGICVSYGLPPVVIISHYKGGDGTFLNWLPIVFEVVTAVCGCAVHVVWCGVV